MAAALEQTSSTESGSEMEEEYEVEKIVGVCESKGETLYKVRWLNYSPSWDTWEPYGNLESCHEMMKAYSNRHKKLLAKQKIVEIEEDGESVAEFSRTPKTPKPKKNSYVYLSSDEEVASTLKDRFWHDLERGEISNILDGGDLYSKVKSQGRAARPQSFRNMFKESQQEDEKSSKSHEKIAKSHEKIAKPHEKIAKPQVKRTASGSGAKKSTRPHKTLKHHHAVTKKVTEKVNIEKTPMPTPASESGSEVETLKDSFWQDLEDGKIKVDFGSDLYSKVKGSSRAARPKSFENMFKIRQPHPKKESVKVSGSKRKVKVKQEKLVATATEFVDLTAADGDFSNSSESSAHSSPDSKADDSVGLPVVNLGLRVKIEDGVGYGDAQPDDIDDKPLSHRVKRENSDVDSVSSKSQSAAKRDDTRSEQDLNSKKSNENLVTKNSSESSADVANKSPMIVDEVSLSDVDSNNIFSRVSVDSNDSVSRVKAVTLVDSNNSVSGVEPVACVASNTCVSNAQPVILLDSSNRASNMEPVPSDTGPPPVCFSPSPAAMTAPNSECCSAPVEVHRVNNNTLTCTDPYKAGANLPDLSVGSKHVPMQTNQGIAESPDQTFGISASLTSLIDLNARHMDNGMKRAEVSSDNPVPRMLLTDYQKSNVVRVGHVKGVARPIEGTGSVATLTVPDISTILPRLNSKRQMSLEDCANPGSSLVDWGIDGNPSVFQMNGAVNGAPTCLASSEAQGGDMLYSSMVDYTQDVNMDDVRSLYSFVNPQSRDSFLDDNHAVTKKIRVDDTQNPSTAIPSGLDSILATDFINDHMIESMREIVRNTRSKPQGYSCDVQSSQSSAERNTDNLQKQVGDGPYDSSKRLHDIDERIPMNVQVGMRHEYLPALPQQPVEAERENGILDGLLELDIDVEPMKETLKPSMKTSYTDISEVTNEDILHAVQANDYEMVDWALEHGPGIFDLDQRDAAGLTLIMIAARNGFDDVLEVLVLHGANENATTKTGVTALTLATVKGRQCTVELLLLLGAHMNIRTESHEVALVKAIKLGHRNIVKLLLDHGANFGCPQNDNMTALEYAKGCKSKDCLDILNEHIGRLTAEFENQMHITLNETAKVVSVIFPMQCFALCEGQTFKVMFQHELQSTKVGSGMLLFMAHAQVSPSGVQCRFYGASAVTAVTLNGVALHAVTKENNFVMSFSPLQDKDNELVLQTVHAPSSKMKLIVCAYKAQLV